METSDLINVNIETIISSLVSLITGTAAGIFLLRRRLSRDNVEITKDKAEGDLIHYLEKQLERIDGEREKHLERSDKLEKERLHMTEKVFKLTSEVESFTLQLRILKDLTTSLSNSIELYKKRISFLEQENNELDRSLQLKHHSELKDSHYNDP